MKKLFLLLLAVSFLFASCNLIFNPETPDTPDTPVNPETPTNPDTPVNPETPSTPEVPENPETPDDPIVNPENPDNQDDEPEVQKETVTITLDFADIEVIYTEVNGTYTFTAVEGFERYEWTTESGYKLSTTNVLVLDTSSYPAGTYKFYLTAIKNGLPYSEKVQILKVQE